jgi:hypothetical protein
MWVVDNNTPFGIGRAFARDGQGGEVFLLAVKGSFVVRADGSLRCADEQTPPAVVPSWNGEAGASSLDEDTEMVLHKPATDVIVVGHAYAPGGRPVPQVDVAWRVGNLERRLRAFGVRVWTHHRATSSVVPSAPRPLQKVPLVYERAFGGKDPAAPAGRPNASASNPVGSGFAHDPRALVDAAAPELEIPGVPLKAGPFDAAPAGFGPVAPGWAPRVRFAGTYDEAWRSRRAPLPPTDFDDRFFCSAPAAQQVTGRFSGGEPVELANMTPEGRLATRLPRIEIRARAMFLDGEARAVAQLNTVRIEPDHRRIRLVWLAAMACHGREHLLRRAAVDWEGDHTCLSP